MARQNHSHLKFLEALYNLGFTVCQYFNNGIHFLLLQILDSNDLVIHGAIDESTGEKLDFVLSEKGFVGSKLQIKLPSSNADVYGSMLTVANVLINIVISKNMC